MKLHLIKFKLDFIYLKNYFNNYIKLKLNEYFNIIY